MRYLNLLLLVVFLAFAENTFAQESNNEEKKAEFISLRQELEGFYQIQVINSRAFPTISYSLLKEIEEKRLLNKNSFVYVREDIRVHVLGKLAEPKYLTEDSKIVYLNE